MLDENSKKLLDSIIELLGNAFGSVDYALEQFVKIALTLPKDEQIKIKESIEILLQHMESSIQETKFAIAPIKDGSKEYSV